MSNQEQTLSIIKPDAVERNLVDEIKKIFTSNNLKIKESKKIKISKEEAYKKINTVINNGLAAEKFEMMVAALGGPKNILSFAL